MIAGLGQGALDDIKFGKFFYESKVDFEIEAE
jgi:hypothetical protein